MKQRWLALAFVLMLVFVAGCQSKGSTEQAACQVEVFVSVVNAAADDVLFERKAVCLEEEATAYDALVATGLDLEASGAGEMVYVQGVDGVRERSAGQDSGWVYAYNGEPGQVGAGAQEVRTDDVIEWRFEEDAIAFFE